MLANGSLFPDDVKENAVYKDHNFDQIVKYIVGSREKEALENNFTYHPPRPGQPERYVQLRDKAKELAYLIHELCPPSRERNLAITNLEQAIYWANGSIARNE